MCAGVCRCARTCRSRLLGRKHGAHATRLLWEDHQAVAVQTVDPLIATLSVGRWTLWLRPLIVPPGKESGSRSSASPPRCLHGRQVV